MDERPPDSSTSRQRSARVLAAVPTELRDSLLASREAIIGAITVVGPQT